MSAGPLAAVPSQKSSSGVRGSPISVGSDAQPTRLMSAAVGSGTHVHADRSSPVTHESPERQLPVYVSSYSTRGSSPGFPVMPPSLGGGPPSWVTPESSPHPPSARSARSATERPKHAKRPATSHLPRESSETLDDPSPIGNEPGPGPSSTPILDAHPRRPSSTPILDTHPRHPSSTPIFDTMAGSAIIGTDRRNHGAHRDRRGGTPLGPRNRERISPSTTRRRSWRASSATTSSTC